MDALYPVHIHWLCVSVPTTQVSGVTSASNNLAGTPHPPLFTHKFFVLMADPEEFSVPTSAYWATLTVAQSLGQTKCDGSPTLLCAYHAQWT